MMKAVMLNKAMSADEMKIVEVPIPQVKSGWVLIKVKGFGINRSEIYTRDGLSPSVAFPRIIGIECVGEIVNASDSQFEVGQRVCSMMGGLGRSFDGSYAEYVLIPSTQVYAMDFQRDWSSLAAMPEMYYTAWCSLDTLKLQKDDMLFIRGATSSVGIACIQIAHKMGINIAASTRTKEKFDLLKQYGADDVFIDDDTLPKQVLSKFPNGVDKIIELVGTKTIKSSFALLHQGGILCMNGILGGEWELSRFAPMDFIPSGSYLTIYDSKEINEKYLYAMFDFIKEHDIQPPIEKVFSFDHIAQAHKLMESNTCSGKIVIMIS